MRTDVRYRVAVAGAELAMAVLADEPDGCVAIDLESGAFVRAIHPPSPDDASPGALDVVMGEIAAPLAPPDASRPEAVQLTAPPIRTGRLTRQRAERYLAPLQHPPHGPLLGVPGVAVPYWTLSGDRPSVTLVEPAMGPQVRWGPGGYECRFAWRGTVHQLPLGDRGLAASLWRQGVDRCAGRELTRHLGFRPGHLLVVLTPPTDGYCYKQVSALLPAS